MRNALVSIRWKIMIMVAVSGVVATVGVMALLLTAQLLYNLPPVNAVLTSPNRREYGTLVIFTSWFAAFIVSFVLLTRGILRYLHEIGEAVNRVAAGDLDIYIPVKANDELGRLADNVNRMAVRLKRSIEEERQAEQSKYDLITGVSHDLRTPLTSILGYLELIEDAKQENLSPEDLAKLGRWVSIANEKARGLKGLIDDLFEFTRVNYGSFPLRPEAVNLGRLLEQLAEEFVPILEEAGMEYRLSLPQDRVYVRGDPALLVRLFENLLSNAVRYGADGRFLDIELVAGKAPGPAPDGASHTEPDAALPATSGATRVPGWAAVRVANYGPPIPESQLSRIFERFARIEASRSRDTGGAGLGLAIAKSIVDLHGGNIRAYSDNESGRTVFEVDIPRQA